MAIPLLRNKVKLRLIASETGLTLSQLYQLCSLLKKGTPPLIKGRGRDRKIKEEYPWETVAAQKNCIFFTS